MLLYAVIVTLPPIVQAVGMAVLYKEKSVKPKFHLFGHVTTRHDSLPSPCILVEEKVVRAVSRMLYSKRDTSVTTSATGAMRNFVFNVYKVMIVVIRFNKRTNFICELK